MQVVPTKLAGQAISIDTRGREDPLPDPFPAGVRVLPEQGSRQRDPACPGCKIISVLSLDGRQMAAEICLGDGREHCDPILISLAATDDDLVSREVDVLDPEATALEDA
jgi:hypothetical protein